MMEVGSGFALRIAAKLLQIVTLLLQTVYRNLTTPDSTVPSPISYHLLFSHSTQRYRRTDDTLQRKRDCWYGRSAFWLKTGDVIRHLLFDWRRLVMITQAGRLPVYARQLQDSAGSVFMLAYLILSRVLQAAGLLRVETLAYLAFTRGIDSLLLAGKQLSQAAHSAHLTLSFYLYQLQLASFSGCGAAWVWFPEKLNNQKEPVYQASNEYYSFRYELSSVAVTQCTVKSCQLTFVCFARYSFSDIVENE